MATILKNVVQFTGLVVGVPTSLAHNLNINGTAIAPDFVLPATSGFTITANATTITVTRDSADAAAGVDVYCERWHSIERVLPLPGQLTGLIPFIAIGGGVGGGGGVDLQNNSTPVAGGPFTTLDLIDLVAADAGGGTATVTNAGSGNPQRFQYTVTGLEPDLTEIVIALPAARADAFYLVTATWANWTALTQIGVNNSSRTDSQFVLSLAAPATVDDVFTFFVADPT